MNSPTCYHCGLPPESKSLLRRINQPSPYAAYFNSPTEQTPTLLAKIGSFTRILETELLDCDADIACVQDLLDMLKEERDDGEFFIAQHKRLISRVHALPPEILLVIFRYCLNPNLPPDVPSHPSYTLYGRRKPIPWVLSAVCSRWRSILLGTPSMWASFDVSFESPLPCLEHALRLSRHAPLHFSLYLRDSDNNIYLQALVKQAARWESVHIDVLLETFTSLDRLVHMPLLKKLSISLQQMEHRRIVDSLISVLSRFKNCPQLNELCIIMQGEEEGITGNFQTTATSIPWANLSKLSVSFEHSSSDILCNLLVACVNLRQLNVTCFDGGVLGGNYAPLSHSGITSLVLANPPTLISHITYPALTHVSFENTEPHAALSFLSQHPRRISHFELCLKSCETLEPWGPVLELLPDVVHFTLRLDPERLYRSPPPKHIWIFESLGNVRLPSLHTLTVDLPCHLLNFCENSDTIPFVASARTRLRKLEVYSERCRRWDWRHFY